MEFEAKALTVMGALGIAAAMMLSAPTALADPDAPPPPPPPAQDAPAEVAHLASPENLPPGTSLAPVGPQESNGVTYLREMWHAVQTQEISGKDALLLLTQRPLDADAVPPNGLPAGPTPPQPAAPPRAPADAPPPAPVDVPPPPLPEVPPPPPAAAPLFPWLP